MHQRECCEYRPARETRTEINAGDRAASSQSHSRHRHRVRCCCDLWERPRLWVDPLIFESMEVLVKHTSCSTDNEGQHPAVFHWFHNTVQYIGPQTNGRICGRQRQVGREVSNRNQEAHQIGGRTKPQSSFGRCRDRPQYGPSDRGALLSLGIQQ